MMRDKATDGALNRLVVEMGTGVRGVGCEQRETVTSEVGVLT
jgi:hypothetical protein